MGEKYMNLKKINLIYRKSKLFDVVRSLDKYLSKIMYNSFFYKTLFHKSNGEKFFAAGFIYRILNYILGIAVLIGNFFSNKSFYQDSFIKKNIEKIEVKNFVFYLLFIQKCGYFHAWSSLI